jgi:hypothetical protein
MGVCSLLEMPNGLDRQEGNGHPGLPRALNPKALQSSRVIMRRVAPKARRRGLVKG